MYLIIDELLTLTKNKEINKILMELLAVARHFNIFVIGIAQEGTKENLKFKNLFNARVCFKMIEDSSYKTVLGCSVEEQLQKQEFYLFLPDVSSRHSASFQLYCRYFLKCYVQ